MLIAGICMIASIILLIFYELSVKFSLMCQYLMRDLDLIYLDQHLNLSTELYHQKKHVKLMKRVMDVSGWKKDKGIHKRNAKD